MKKVLAFLLTAALLLSLFAVAPLSASAGTPGDYEVLTMDDGTAEITRYTGSGGDIVIPSVYNGYTVTAIGRDAFKDCTELTSVVIPDSVIYIGESAFENCSSLTAATIPKSVIYICDSAFENCSSLTAVTIPKSVGFIGEKVFCLCTALATITVDPDNPVYRSVGDTIISDDRLIACGIHVTDISEGIVYIGNSVFRGHTNLTSITIPDTVYSIFNYAFADCPNLREIVFPDSVHKVGFDIFGNTPWYDAQPDGMILLGKVLYEYKGETPENVTIPDGVICIAPGALHHKETLKKVVIPDSTEIIGHAAFKYCQNLSSVKMGSSVYAIFGRAFFWCDSLKELAIPASVEVINRDEDPIGFTVVDNTSVPVEGFVLYGTPGSEAEKYADEKGLTFRDISELPPPEEPAPEEPAPEEPAPEEPAPEEPVPEEPTPDDPIPDDPNPDEPAEPTPANPIDPDTLEDSEYGLWIGGVAVTAANCANIQGNGISGSLSYDPASNVLTLRDAEVTPFFNCFNTDDIACFAAIYSQKDIEIRLEGENGLKCDQTPESEKRTRYVHGVFALRKSLTLSGTGTLNTDGILAEALTISQGATVNSDANSSGARVSRSIEVDSLLVNGTLIAHEYSYLSAYQAIYATRIDIGATGVCDVSLRSDFGNIIAIPGYSAPAAAAVYLRDNGSMTVSGTVSISSVATAPGSSNLILNGYGVYCDTEATLSILRSGSMVIDTNKRALTKIRVGWSDEDTAVMAGSSESEAEPVTDDSALNNKYVCFTPKASPVPSEPTVAPTEPAPAEPTEPAPAEPTEPAPVEPSEPAPAEPSEPAPAEPTEPGTLGEPEEPTEPGTPGESEQPTEPGTSGEPEQPDDSGTPATPDQPDDPDNSDDSDGVIPGDVNRDGKVDNRDAMLLDRYIAGWDGYADRIDMKAADISGDGVVNNRDAMILDRYIAGWDGYDKYFV